MRERGTVDFRDEVVQLRVNLVVCVIPVKEPKPRKLEQCWEAGPIADSKFTEKEILQITAKGN